MAGILNKFKKNPYTRLLNESGNGSEDLTQRSVRIAPEYIKTKSKFKKTKRMTPTYYTYGPPTSPKYYEDVRIHPGLGGSVMHYNRKDPEVNRELAEYKLWEMEVAAGAVDDIDYHFTDKESKDLKRQRKKAAKRAAIKRWEEENKPERSKLDKIKMRLQNTKRDMNFLLGRRKKIKCGTLPKFKYGYTDDELTEYTDYVNDLILDNQRRAAEREEESSSDEIDVDNLPYFQGVIPPH